MRTIPITQEAKRFQEIFLQMGRDRPLRDPIAQMCEKLSLTAPQVHAIMWLGHDGALPMRDLAQRVGISVQTVTGVVDRLEHHGYVQRARDEKDRRVVHVTLTRQGSTMFRRLDEQIIRNLAMGLGVLEPGERETLFKLVEKVLRGASALAAEVSSRGQPRRRPTSR
jgi:DNA-binding MarR family transcriptional regulator